MIFNVLSHELLAQIGTDRTEIELYRSGNKGSSNAYLHRLLKTNL